MATERRVSVRLDANVGSFVAGMKTAEAAVRGLTREIDTSNDRTAWLAQSILALGPALAPLGAAAVPMISGLATQMTVAATAAVTAGLAFNGVGDALGALNDYQLDPSIANFDKMTEAMNKIGPAGAEFVTFLDDIGPRFSDLQMAAREGMFPGVQEGLESFLVLLPRVRHIVSDTAEAMGELTSKAGAGLAGDGFHDFFEFLDRNAGPLLVELGQTIGNFVEGLAAMMVAFEPLTLDFSQGFLAMSDSFAQWSHGLSESAGFEEFVEYVRESIPRVQEMLGALNDALVSLMQAAAPVGDIMVPIFETLFDVLSAFLDTPFGPVFLGIAAAMSLYGRGAALVAITTGNLGKALAGTAFSATALKSTFITSLPSLRQFGTALAFAAHSNDTLKRSMLGGSVIASNSARSAYLAKDAVNSFARSAAPAGAAAALLAVSMSDLDDKAGLTSTTMGGLLGMMAGPYGFALGSAIGFTMDLAAANDELDAAVTRMNASLDESIAKQQAAAESVRDELEALKEAGDSKNFWSFDASIADNMGYLGSKFSELTGATGEARDELSRFEARAKNLPGLTQFFIDPMGDIRSSFQQATDAVENFAKTVEAAFALLDKRASLRAARASVREFSKTLKDALKDLDGKKLERGTAAYDEVEAALDGIARSSLTAAEHMKGMAKVDYLDRMRDKFIAAAIDLGLTGRRARALADDLGLLDKKNPTVDVNTKPAREKLDEARKWLKLWGLDEGKAKVDVDHKPARTKLHEADRWLWLWSQSEGKATLDADPKPALNMIDLVKQQLRYLDGLTATTYVDTVRRGRVSPGDQEFDSGGYTGNIDPSAVAGIVHGREVVIPAAIARRDAALLRARYGFLPGMDQLTGYATGGLVAERRATQRVASASSSTTHHVSFGRAAVDLIYPNGDVQTVEMVARSAARDEIAADRRFYERQNDRD